MSIADIVSDSSEKTGDEKCIGQASVEALIDSIKKALSDGENV